MRKVFFGFSLVVVLATLVVGSVGNSNTKVATNMGPDPMGIQAMNSTTV
ncbi:hypothetical protein JJB07_05300 [Tumebacillus sp. ITR2]|uniref:Phr family secreted Rap phosphatase inhibitor n=1 Tax=Tumebacillus amylolyticus TaxID=2801339 RepID=A0ABS1J717_9BACL|nr:hypothetical protein [Tumebacillus amylolyticus]MBL0386064.1 hypothetical protein [Tumebacillus amylolyticus]